MFAKAPEVPIPNKEISFIGGIKIPIEQEQ